jgi:uncharacterized membrane protein
VTTTAQETSPPQAAEDRRRFRYTLPGAWVALVFACLAFTPSLLPRSALLQGVVCGITAAIGYGVGVAGAWAWRAVADRDPRPPRPGAWRVFAIAATAALLLALGLGQWQQAQLRDLMGAPPPNPLLLPLLPLVAAGIFTGLVAVSRALRGAYHRVARRLHRWMGPRAANALGWVAVVVGTWLVVSGLLLNGLASLADRSFSVRNTATADGVTQPTSTLRSGGPGSLVSWDSLGRQGRTITGTGPSAEEIAAWSGSESATEPIRAYAGTLSAGDAEARAELAVKDLERAGGFDRTNLLVATTTGSGWLDSGAVDSFEYLTGGDSAVVAMQYSYLPSWLSYLVDQKKAREAGRELFDAVYDRWSKRPPADRPRLFVFGLSLGSFGGETAFSGEYDLRNRTAGSLFAGPPNFNTLYREFTDDRDPGSHEVEPVYKDGRTVRFTNDVVGGVPPAAQWNGTRVLYLQHPSDPIVWWSPRLIWDRPDWLGEPHGRDVVDSIVWIPLVTFWQVTADLPLSTGVPDGHGHNYHREFVDGWARVLQPAGWTPDKAEQLREIITASE